MNINIKQKWNNASKSEKMFAGLFSLVIILNIILCIIIIANSKVSSVKLENLVGAKPESLGALDSNASKGMIKETGFANFKFSEAQKKLFVQTYEENGTVAVTIRVQILPTTKQSMLLGTPVDLPFQFGFLSEEDFNSKGKLVKQYFPNAKRILIQGNLQNAPEYFDISFAVQKNNDITKFIPEGFFVYSNLRTKIVAAYVTPAQIGFDFSDIPYFGFGANGGKIDFEKKNFDFAGAALVFPVQNTSKTCMPEIVISLDEDVAFKSALGDSVYSEVNIGGEKLWIKNVIQANELIIPAGALKAPFSRLEIVKNPECIKSIIMRSVKLEKYQAVRTDPGLLVKHKPVNWRNHDFEVFEWDRYPGILFFDTKNYTVQEKLFSRLAYFVEKEGYKGTLLTNEQLEGKHGYNAHDYSPESLAEFFNKAQKTGFVLNPEELELKEILLYNKLLILSDDGISVLPGKGGLVSISQESEEWKRRNLLAHEGWHTLFFGDEEFRNYVAAVYYTMDQNTLQFLIDYFKSQPTLGYDVNDEYLMHNEMMAYIMQQPISEVRKYFVSRAGWGTVMKYTPDLAAYIRHTDGQGFEDAAIALNDFVFDKYGVVCGNISLITR